MLNVTVDKGASQPQCASCNSLFSSAAVLLLPGGHADGLAQRSDEGGQADEVAVFSAPLCPWDVVQEPAGVGHGGCLPKVYHPYAGLAAVVVDEEKRAANHLIRSDGNVCRFIVRIWSKIEFEWGEYRLDQQKTTTLASMWSNFFCSLCYLISAISIPCFFTFSLYHLKQNLITRRFVCR